MCTSHCTYAPTRLAAVQAQRGGFNGLRPLPPAPPLVAEISVSRLTRSPQCHYSQVGERGEEYGCFEDLLELTEDDLVWPDRNRKLYASDVFWLIGEGKQILFDIFYSEPAQNKEPQIVEVFDQVHFGKV